MEEMQQLYQIAAAIMERGDNKGKTWEEVMDLLEKNKEEQKVSTGTPIIRK